jgi:multidrug efflux pump
MMCALLLCHKPRSKTPGPISKFAENFFTWIWEGYTASLRVVLRHPAITLGVLLVTIAATGFLFMVVPKGFFPQQDNGTVFGGMQGSQDASFQAMQGAAVRINDTVRQDPAVAAVVSFVGGNGATNSGFVYTALKPLDERKISASDVINRLRPRLGGIPGAMTFLQAGQDLRIGGRQSNAQYQYTIQSENLPDLVKWGPVVLEQMRKLPGFTDVNSDQQNAGLQASLTYDRQTAARLGLSAQLIDETLYDAFGQRQVSTMFTSLNQYHVVMEVDPQFWQSPAGLDTIYLRQPPPSTATPSPSSASILGGASTDTVSTAPAEPVSTPLPIPIVTSPQPNNGPIAAATPVYPFSTSQVTPAPIPTPAIPATPSATAAASSSSTDVTSIMATPLPTVSAILASTPTPLISTTSPTPAPFSVVATTVPASTASVATSSPGGALQSTPTASPGVVPLSAVASYQPTTAPIAVTHQGQFPAVTISFNLAGGIALSDAVTAIEQMQRRIGMPGTVHGTFTGTAQAFQASLASEPVLILTALIAVYLVLGILYESLIHPITILSTLPSAGVGAILALMLFRTDLSVIGIIGILLLIGIVKKNAILMVDFALEAERSGGVSPREAIYQACLLRFRPIMMTTTAALFGALPLILSTGMGAELRRPLGITIVGGLIVSQMLTLYTTPVIYLVLDRLRQRRTLRRRGKNLPALGWQSPQPASS